MRNCFVKKNSAFTLVAALVFAAACILAACPQEPGTGPDGTNKSSSV